MQSTNSSEFKVSSFRKWIVKAKQLYAIQIIIIHNLER